MKKIFYILTLLLFSCSDSGSENDKDTTAPGETVLSGQYLSSSVNLAWTQVEDVDLNFYELSQSTDGSSFEIVRSVGKDTLSLLFQGLTNGVKYYFKLRAVDNAGNKAVFSNVLELTPTTGDDLVSTSWQDILSGDYDGAIESLNAVIDLGLDAKDNARVAIGWAYLKRANGDITSIDLATALTELKLVEENDSYSGQAILGLLLNDYTVTTLNADKLKNNTSYIHEYFSHINLRYVLIHGAYGYWFRGLYTKVNEYLDLINPDLAPYSLDRDGQLSMLQSLVGELDSPIIERLEIKK